MLTEILPQWLYCEMSVAEVLLLFFQQIAKLRLQLQRSKQVSRQSKDGVQSSLQLPQQAQHSAACQSQVSYCCQHSCDSQTESQPCSLLVKILTNSFSDAIFYPDGGDMIR